MNKLLVILILIIVLLGGGIVGGYIYFGFASELKNYTGNGVSFKYPADYEITELKDNSTFLIAKNTKNPNLTFQISKSSVNGTIYPGKNLDEYANDLVNDFKLRGWIVVLVDNTTIFVDKTDDEVQAYSISYTEKLPSQSSSDSVNGHILMFDKNGIRYTIDFQGKGKEKYDAGGRFQVESSFNVL